MTKVIIIDDELHAIKQLEKQLAKLDDIEIIKTFNSSTEAVTQLLTYSFDILFLDIEMPKLNGFEFLKTLNSYPFSVIFTTAYSQYAIDAFKYTAFDYLLKPITKTQLEECLQRWLKNNSLNSSKQQISYLDNLINNTSVLPNQLTISTHSGHFIIKFNDILYCESDSNYTRFHLINNKTLIASKTLKEYEELLQKHDFIRIHKSYLVNFNKIINIRSQDGYNVELINGILLPISRNKYSSLMKKIKI